MTDQHSPAATHCGDVNGLRYVVQAFAEANGGKTSFTVGGYTLTVKDVAPCASNQWEKSDHHGAYKWRIPTANRAFSVIELVPSTAGVMFQAKHETGDPSETVTLASLLFSIYKQNVTYVIQ